MRFFNYYKDKAGLGVARKIRNDIFTTTKQLKKQPESGQLEPFLEKLGENHKYLVEGNYKIIYKKISEGILITDIFDTRQNPIKINDKNRKPSR